MLAWTIYISFLGAAGAAAAAEGQRGGGAHLGAADGGGRASQLRSRCSCSTAAGEMLTITRVPWVPSLGIEYHLAADGISLTLMLLTGIIAITGILFSWNIEQRAKEFFAFYLLLIGAVYGVFLSCDLFLLFVFYEIVIIPKYFLIAIWGSTRREYGAMKLALYSFVGSAMVLIGSDRGLCCGRCEEHGARANSHGSHFRCTSRCGRFPLVFVGFAILAGLWPLAHLGADGPRRRADGGFHAAGRGGDEAGGLRLPARGHDAVPAGLGPWGFHVLGLGSWRDVFALLAVIGIVYGALVALVQKDFKFVIGYSSVSHMGFILLGLMTLNQLGLSGAVLQMFSHGILAGLLFAVVGRMVYARTHTRDLAVWARWKLNKAIPFAAVTFVIAGMASMGLPGFSGFCGGVDGPGGRLARVSHVCGLRGIRHRGWRRIHLARDAKGIFRGGGAGSATPGPPLPPITVPERWARWS